jgi:thioredoxin 1
MVKDILDAEFEVEVIKASNNKLVLVDFWAPWCGPCVAMAPTLNEIAAEMPEIEIIKINIDESQAYAKQFGVRSIPNLLLFKKGEVVSNIVGLQPKAELLKHINLVK